MIHVDNFTEICFAKICRILFGNGIRVVLQQLLPNIHDVECFCLYLIYCLRISNPAASIIFTQCCSYLIWLSMTCVFFFCLLVIFIDKNYQFLLSFGISI